VSLPLPTEHPLSREPAPVDRPNAGQAVSGRGIAGWHRGAAAVSRWRSPWPILVATSRFPATTAVTSCPQIGHRGLVGSGEIT